MPVILRDGPLAGERWPVLVAPDDTTISTRIGAAVKVVYSDTGETDPQTSQRIFAFRPPKPEPVIDPVDEDADGE